MRILYAGIALVLSISFILFSTSGTADALYVSVEGVKYIKWVDFDVTASALEDAMKLDVESYNNGNHVDQ